MIVLNDFSTKTSGFFVDAEGMDLEVLESSDWSRYRPTLVLVEEIDFDVEKMSKSAIYSFMRKYGYCLFAKTLATRIFEEEAAFHARRKAQIH